MKLGEVCVPVISDSGQLTLADFGYLGRFNKNGWTITTFLFSPNGIHDFFKVIRKQYETGSVILTTNRKFEDWEQLFGDKAMVSAIIDRLVHHAYIIKITGDSYQVKNTATPDNNK
ncbi:MAG TPA: hypothetical protein DEQ09_09255 [Bacteroidales bacterium]|nr:hypothetical protein [Bacteroidales bacterium]